MGSVYLEEQPNRMVKWNNANGKENNALYMEANAAGRDIVKGRMAPNGERNNNPITKSSPKRNKPNRPGAPS